MSWKQARDVLLFLGGMIGLFYETIVTADVRVELILVFSAMLGLPAFLRVDERNNSGG